MRNFHLLSANELLDLLMERTASYTHLFREEGDLSDCRQDIENIIAELKAREKSTTQGEIISPN